MLRDQDLYDFGEYPAEHPNYSEMNKKVLGKCKDELNSIPLEEFLDSVQNAIHFCSMAKWRNIK